MWPFRRTPDLLEEQRRELEREHMRERGRAPGPPDSPIGGPGTANWHGTAFRMTIRSEGGGAGPSAPEPPDMDVFPPGVDVHEFSGTPGEVAAQVGKALLRALLGRPRTP